MDEIELGYAQVDRLAPIPFARSAGARSLLGDLEGTAHSHEDDRIRSKASR